MDGGREYFFGAADRHGGYDGCWALEQPAEKRAFERCIDRVMARWREYPGFHIYHYGAYETTAVKRLMSRYGFTRRVDLTAATRALVRFEAALESGEAEGTPNELRAEIEGYNRDDCLSTLPLAGCLEELRRNLRALTGRSVPRPPLRDDEREQERESAPEVAAVFEMLTAGLPEDDDGRDEEQRARRLLAHLLEFHRREEKSMWWEYFRPMPTSGARPWVPVWDLRIPLQYRSRDPLLD